MGFIERNYLLVEIAEHIQRGNTGTLEEFAAKCDIKKDKLHDYIEILRQLVAKDSTKVLYDRDRKTYYFYPQGKFSTFKFTVDNEYLNE